MRGFRRTSPNTGRAIVAAASMLALVASAGAASAAPGIITQNINMRAGPDIGYPLVASLPQGTPVEIYGCLSGWNWCDTQAGGARGWVAGPGLAVMYGPTPQPLIGYGGLIGLPFIGFNVDSYWGSYYRGRPWFGQEERWRGGPGHFGGGPIHGGPDIGGPGFGGPNRFGGGQGGFRQGGGPGGGPGGGQGGPGAGPGNVASRNGGPGGGGPGGGHPGGPGGGPGGGGQGGGGGGHGGPQGGGHGGGDHGGGGRGDGGHPQPN